MHKITNDPLSDTLVESNVNFLNTTLLGFPAWQIYAAVALLLSCVLLMVFWPKKTSGQKRGIFGGANGAVRDFMSTVRLSDTQRIDRLHRVIKISIGEKIDLKDLSFGRLSKFAVTFNGVEQAGGQDFAQIKLELGGAAADCGASVKELGENDFLMPRATPDDHRCSIHFTSASGDVVSFLQVKVQKIDAVERSAAIDVLHLRGRQAA